MATNTSTDEVGLGQLSIQLSAAPLPRLGLRRT